MEQMRKAFEEAYHEQFGRMPQNWNEALGKYFDAHAQGAWWGWQASREALVIELPTPDDSYCEECNDCWERGVQGSRLAIEAAGAKVK